MGVTAVSRGFKVGIEEGCGMKRGVKGGEIGSMGGWINRKLWRAVGSGGENICPG